VWLGTARRRGVRPCAAGLQLGAAQIPKTSESTRACWHTGEGLRRVSSHSEGHTLCTCGPAAARPTARDPCGWQQSLPTRCSGRRQLCSWTTAQRCSLTQFRRPITGSTGPRTRGSSTTHSTRMPFQGARRPSRCEAQEPRRNSLSKLQDGHTARLALQDGQAQAPCILCARAGPDRRGCRHGQRPSAGAHAVRLRPVRCAAHAALRGTSLRGTSLAVPALRRVSCRRDTAHSAPNEPTPCGVPEGGASLRP
jgi:hypothetical protein